MVSRSGERPQVPVQELRGAGQDVDDVGAVEEAVRFGGVALVLEGFAGALQRLYPFLGGLRRDDVVEQAVQDQHRPVDIVYLVDGGPGLVDGGF